MYKILRGGKLKGSYQIDPKNSWLLAAFEKNGSVLVGDVDPLAMQELSSAYTPVPGGVGPLTIAMLMVNTFDLADMH